MNWTKPFITPSSTEDSDDFLSFREKFVMAKIIYFKRYEFSGNLNYVAKELEFKPSFFRKAVQKLIKFGWLEETPSLKEGRGRPSKDYRVILAFYEVDVVCSDLQALYVEHILFKGMKLEGDSSLSEGKKKATLLPGKNETVLVVLILSANHTGFVEGLTNPKLSNLSGIAVTSLRANIKYLEKENLVTYWPGGTSRKINGFGWRVSSVYQINIIELISFLFDKQVTMQEPILIKDNAREIFLRSGCIPGPSLTIYNKLRVIITIKELSPVINNCYARVLAAVNYLISCEDVRSDLNVLEGKVMSEALEDKMLDILVKNQVLGDTSFKSVRITSYDQLYRLVSQSLDDGSPLESDIVMYLSLCLGAIRRLRSLWLYELAGWKGKDCKEVFIVTVGFKNGGDLCCYALNTE